MGTVNVTLSPPRAVSVNVGGRYSGNVPVYSGMYEVTPKAEEQVVLHTADKLLTHDVTVQKVPFYEVTNLSGGKTFIIGEVQNV